MMNATPVGPLISARENDRNQIPHQNSQCDTHCSLCFPDDFCVANVRGRLFCQGICSPGAMTNGILAQGEFSSRDDRIPCRPTESTCSYRCLAAAQSLEILTKKRTFTKANASKEIAQF